MFRSSLTRREMIAVSAGIASGLLALPTTISALPLGAPPTSDLDAALAAARWLRRSRVETKDGAAWPVDPLNPSVVGLDLFDGMPGVVLFHLELFDATNDRVWLDEARLGANELIGKLPALQQSQSCGLYDGLAGVAFVLEETHRATGDGRYRDAVKQAIGMIHGLARKTTSGAEWSGRSATPDIVSGSAGIGLFLLWADTIMDDSESRSLALATGRRLLERGIPAHGGTKWLAANDGAVSYPNFARGTSGVAYFLAELLRATGDRACMAGALSGAKYLESIANTESNGFKVFHHEPGGENLYQLGWCHGPAATARLFHQLGQVTGRAKWLELAHACARSIVASGAPVLQSAGSLIDVGQCSGGAGIGEFLIALQREAAHPAYATLISGISANTLSRATTDGDGMKWANVADSASPNNVVAQTGFMQGAAGIGTFYLHADALAKGRRPAITWPDSAWARPCAAPRANATRDMSYLNNGRSSPSC